MFNRLYRGFKQSMDLRLWSVSATIFLVLCGVLLSNPSLPLATALAAAEPTETISVVGARAAGAKTHGGAAPFGKIFRVTTLADRGRGSLRHAIDRSGPRVIVFDVGGIIQLNSDLNVLNPYLTIAGQSAPDPGITLSGGTLRIRTSNVVVQHIAVRPGPSDNPKISVKRDAIAVSECSKCRIKPTAILIDNVSVSWSSDELIGTNGSELRHITVRNSILSEALAHAGHPKGSHTAGILIGQGVRGVEIVGNLFSSNGFRNPAVNAGAAAVIINNFIYNPHNRAAHINAGPRSKRKTFATVIGNVLVPGPNTRNDVPLLGLARNIARRTPNASIYAAHNQTYMENGEVVRNISRLELKSRPPLVAANWKTLPTDQVRVRALHYAGSRPARRNAIDQRIIDDVKSNRGRIIDLPAEVGGLTKIAKTEGVARTPRFPFSPSGIKGLLRIEAWLCLEHLSVGGPNNAQCPYNQEQYSTALSKSSFSPDRQRN